MTDEGRGDSSAIPPAFVLFYVCERAALSVPAFSGCAMNRRRLFNGNLEYPTRIISVLRAQDTVWVKWICLGTSNGSTFSWR